MLPDIAVIGAGVFGAWTAHHLGRAGARVTLYDAFGPGHSRSSSGGETRIIRAGYGPDEIYTRMAIESLARWRAFEQRTAQKIYFETGVLLMGQAQDARLVSTAATLQRVGVPFEDLSAAEVTRRYPGIALPEGGRGLLETNAGSLFARRAVQAVVDEAVAAGAGFRLERIDPAAIQCKAGICVFACGPWLPKLFPQLLGSRIFPSRQEIFFFGCPAGDARFRAPAMPTFIDAENFYGMPDIENRGFKIGRDEHGPAIDPDTEERLNSAQELTLVRRHLAKRFPALANAPVTETRVCQYENTSNGDFLIDRHPEHPNVWFVGGGSGHGFKHGPAVGRYATEQITGTGQPEPRFSLATKATIQKREVY